MVPPALGLDIGDTWKQSNNAMSSAPLILMDLPNHHISNTLTLSTVLDDLLYNLFHDSFHAELPPKLELPS